MLVSSKVSLVNCLARNSLHCDFITMTTKKPPRHHLILGGSLKPQQLELKLYFCNIPLCWMQTTGQCSGVHLTMFDDSMCVREQLTHNDSRKKHHKKSQHFHAAHSYVLPAGVFEFDSSAHWYRLCGGFQGYWPTASNSAENQILFQALDWWWEVMEVPFYTPCYPGLLITDSHHKHIYEAGLALFSSLPTPLIVYTDPAFDLE